MRSIVTVVAVLLQFAARALALDATKFVDQPDAWFWSEEGRRIVANVKSWQNDDGGWWKAYDAATTRPATVPKKDDWHRGSTIDNGATTGEMRLLARANCVTQDTGCGAAFDRGLAYLLAAQYPNGGWPQRFPLTGTYGDAITFNDDAMIRVMRLLRDVDDGRDFGFVRQADRSRCRAAVDRGVECILDAQILVDGRLTAWCQQHDATSLAPTKARAYELPSICSAESAAIVAFLMDMPSPRDRVKRSIDAAVGWFEAAKIHDKRVERSEAPTPEGGTDLSLVDAPGGVAWARFYDLTTGRPFVCDRDGVPKASLDEISHERRAGYAWYNDRPAKVIARYARWRAANE